MYYGGELNVPGAPGNNMEYLYGRMPGVLGGPVTPPSPPLGGPVTPVDPGLGGPVEWSGTYVPVVPIGYGGEQGQQIAGNPSFDINESAGTRKIRSIRRLGEGGVGGEKDAAVEMLKRLGGPQLPQVNVPGAPGNLGYQVAQAQTNLLNPFQIQENMNKVNQVNEGTYQGGKGGLVDSFMRKTSDKNDRLIKLMEEAGM